MPLLPNKTLDGKTIDEHYYKAHVTVVSFMYAGCVPCMNEISVLNQLYDEYKNNDKVQLLCVARQFRQQMVEFQEGGYPIMGKIRRGMHVDSMKYAIQPACLDAPSKMELVESDTGKHYTINSECDVIKDVYGVTSFPTTFFVDRKGVIREIHSGGPGKQNDLDFHDKVKAEIEKLLAE